MRFILENAYWLHDRQYTTPLPHAMSLQSSRTNITYLIYFILYILDMKLIFATEQGRLHTSRDAFDIDRSLETWIRAFAAERQRLK